MRTSCRPSVLAHCVPARSQLLQRLAGDLAGKDVIGRSSALAPPLADVSDELQRRCGERKPVLPALLGMRGWLDPKSGLGIELRPGGKHDFAGTAPGDHDHPDAVGRRRAAIDIEPINHRRDLGRTEEPLLGLLRVALDPPCRDCLAPDRARACPRPPWASVKARTAWTRRLPSGWRGPGGRCR